MPECKNRMKKVLIVTNIPNPYRIPLFNELNVQLKKEGIDLKVAFGATTYARRQYKVDPSEFKFDYEILHTATFNIGNEEKVFFLYQGLLRLIKREQPEKIIIIGYSIGTLKIWLRSFFKKTNYLIWSGTILKKGLNDSFLRKLQRKILLKRASGYIAYGSKAKEYLLSMGVKPERIHVGINTVDTTFFNANTELLRASLPPQTKKHLTYIGYLIERKNVIRILEAVKLLSQTRADFILDIVGDGSDRDNLENYVQEHKLHSYVLFHGYKQKQELTQYLCRSNCFLFQTDFDIWGLVLNEAMAAGVPCIASTEAGSSYDLIKEGETGFTADYRNTKDVLKKINFLLDNPEKAKEMGQNARKFIAANASIKISSRGFVNAVLTKN